MLKYLPFIISSVLLNAAAQLFIRKGMTSVGQVGSTLRLMFDYGVSVARNPFIIGGMFCYAVSIFLWMYVLAKVNVSLAYPFQSLGYIVAAFVAFYTLGEPLSFYKLLGIIVICAGVVLISFSPDAV